MIPPSDRDRQLRTHRPGSFLIDPSRRPYPTRPHVEGTRFEHLMMGVVLASSLALVVVYFYFAVWGK